MAQYTEDELNKIVNSVSTLDYFIYLENKNVVKFNRKSGGDYYFLTDKNKFSVNENGFYDFKTGKGGKIISAVMEIENKTWKEAVDFIKEFGNVSLDRDIAERKAEIGTKQYQTLPPKITRKIEPNNEKLISYFKDRGISEEVLKKNTKQIHYQVNGKSYFGIGIENQSGGVEIRNPMMKSKIGKNDYTIINPNQEKMAVFEGMTDMLSFLQLMEENKKKNVFTLCCLNSVTNADKFIQDNKNFQGQVYLLLDADDAGNVATAKLEKGLKNGIDIRQVYGIIPNGNKDLNKYLENRNLIKKQTITNFTNKKLDKNDTTNNTEQGRISNSIEHRSTEIGRDNNKLDDESKSIEKQKSDNNGRKTLDSKNVGNGLEYGSQLSIRFGEREQSISKSMDREKQRDITEKTELGRGLSFGGRNEENEGRARTSSLDVLISDAGGKILASNRLVKDKTYNDYEYIAFIDRNNGNIEWKNGYYDVKEVVDFSEKIKRKNDTTNISKLDELIQKYKGQKITNEQVEELVSLACFVNDKKQIQIYDDITITDELKDLINQYKTGGIAKEGRGILDEYYTNSEIVDTVEFLLQKILPKKAQLDVLEPSVGTGNFLGATKNLPNAKINAFEINPTTAKIAKLFNPQTEINLRSFETEFISDDGKKKDKANYADKYDLIIGNPPYGQHRGFYKGLGEEGNISRYEDYFVKRSIDSLRDEGNLAMVLPSGWLNRQTKLNNAKIIDAYRLPVGAFKGTQIGTDIIILKKDSREKNVDISNFFEENPSKILGEIKEKTNRFGRLENYVSGSLEDALNTINSLNKESQIKNGWYVEFNESAGFNKNYKGLKVDEDLLNEIQKIDKKLNEENASYSKFYVEEYKNGLVVPDSRIRIDIGDGEEVNKEIFETLHAFINGKQTNNIVAEKEEENKNGYYYRTFSVKKKEGEPVEEYQSQDENVIKKHFERMKNDVKNEIVDFEKAFYKNNVAVAILESKTETLSKNQEKKETQTETETLKSISEVLSELKKDTQNPAIIDSIYKYTSLKKKIEEGKLTTEEILQVKNKADRILKNKSKIIKIDNDKTNNNVDYQIQTKPDLKKSILKYHFKKNDEIISTSLQNNTNLSEEEIEAFKLTEYNGEIKISDKKFEKYANFYNGTWLHDFYYAEGNIYEKLHQLEIDKDKIEESQYLKQKSLLEKVLPKPKKIDEITINPNHEFVHNFYLGKMEKSIYNYHLGISENKMVDYNLAMKFKDFVYKLPKDALQGASAWEISEYINNKSVTGSDRERNALVRERRKTVGNSLFQQFIKEELTDDEKKKFVDKFNVNYNNIYIPDYSKFPLFSKINKNFKGNPLKLTEVQKAGIGRLTTKGVGLLAHEVGFGKTLSGILSMHEAMERGNAKRPLIVVPNDSIMKQWVETIYETIPDAKVNVLGNLGATYDLSNFENRDNEITIITYSGFNNIGFSKDITDNLAKKFSYISTNETKAIKNTEREEQIDISKTEELKGKMKKGKIYDWEDFGFDHLTFDEVHNANHIVGKVKIEDRSFSSDFRSQNQRTSALGINTWMASQYIQDKYDGRNITLLSATPFTNKPLEYYSILSLVGNKRLEESGYFNVNNFFETFMEADNEMEIDAVGKVDYKNSVKRFKNNSLFQQLLGEFIDIKGEEDNPELVRPNRINKEYKIPQNDLTEIEYENLNKNFDENESGAILTHILNARLIAISPYLSLHYDGEPPTVKDFIENSPKLKNTMDLIAQNKKDNPSAGQIIYSELAVAEFPKMKDYLLNEVGYKNEEVEIITGGTSKTQREKIQENFNNGKIKVIIGSSAIQEGMNLQENTSDMYLLSLPYNFTALRQTEGRAWRQGNKFESVRINYMLTKDSIDVFMLQKLQAKQARYVEAMKSNVDILDISDISTSELKTALITNPTTRAEIEIKVMKTRIENEIKQLKAESAFVVRKDKKLGDLLDTKSTLEREYKKAKDYIEESRENGKIADVKYWEEEASLKKIKLENVKENIATSISLMDITKEEKEVIKNKLEFNESTINKIVEEIQDLDSLKEKLIEKYTKERELNSSNSVDFIKERELENKDFYKIRKSEKKEDFVFQKAKIIPTRQGIKIQEEEREKISYIRKR